MVGHRGQVRPPRHEGQRQLRVVPNEGPQLDDPPPRPVHADGSPARRRSSRCWPRPASCPKDSEDWAFEIKWDGVRAILFVEGGRVRAQSRNDLDVSNSFPELADIGEFLGMTTCVLDGEIVALGEDGRPSFSRLQHRMHVANRREARRRAAADPVSFVAFDLLYVDGHSLLELPYDERRARLESLRLSGGTFTTTDSFRGRLGTGHPGRHRAERARGCRRQATRLALSARPTASRLDQGQVHSYTGGRRSAGGPTGAANGPGSLGALLLGIPDADGLRYVGKVGTGFSADARAALLQDLPRLAHPAQPLRVAAAGP